MPANRPLWGLLSRRSTLDDTATDLYGRLVAQARAPTFYADLGVPDTPEGRLELVLLHMMLVLRRLQREEADTAGLARALTETFVTDMDDCLREMGVGDISVAKKVNKAAAALFDRSRDYGAALTAGEPAALADLIGRHMLEAGDPPAAEPAARFTAQAASLTAYAFAAESTLDAAGLDAVVACTITFPTP